MVSYCELVIALRATEERPSESSARAYPLCRLGPGERKTSPYRRGAIAGGCVMVFFLQVTKATGALGEISGQPEHDGGL